MCLAERADPGNDRLGDPRDLERASVAELLLQARQVAPVAMDEAAVAAARAESALVGLEEDDVETRLARLQRERRPEAGVAAADDRDIGVGVTLERRRRLYGIRLLEPPDPAYIRCQASASTSPRIPTSSSNSLCPAISGGEIWTTGSPRSSRPIA